MMNFIYIILAMVALYFECAPNIDTRSIITKLFLFMVITGSILSMSQISNSLIGIGLVGYLATQIWKALTTQEENWYE